METFADRTVLITGASAGIGRALALEFANRGAAVGLVARRVDRLAAVAAEIRAAGGRCCEVVADVTRDGEIERAVANVHVALGDIDVAVANAGFVVSGRFDALEVDDYRRQFETNVFGVLRTARTCLEDLERTRGVLVLLGSVAGYAAAPGNSAYCMSKFAIRAFADSLHAEMRPHGVGVVLVSPGFVESEIRFVDRRGRLRTDRADPVPRWLIMPAAKAARLIVDGTGRRRREIVLTGHGHLLKALSFIAPWLVRAGAARGGRRRVAKPETPAAS